MNEAVCGKPQLITRDIAERISQKLFDVNKYAVDIRQKLYGSILENEKSDEEEQPKCVEAFLLQIEKTTNKIGQTLAEINERL